MSPIWETAIHLAVAGGVFDGVFLCCPFSPLDVLNEIWDVIGSFIDGFLTYFFTAKASHIFSTKSMANFRY